MAGVVPEVSQERAPARWPRAWLARFVRPQGALRTVEVLPPSRRDEGTWVLLTAAAIVLFVTYVVAFERFGGPAQGGASERSKQLLPFQVLFRDLPGSDQRIFRAM